MVFCLNICLHYHDWGRMKDKFKLLMNDCFCWEALQKEADNFAIPESALF